MKIVEANKNNLHFSDLKHCDVFKFDGGSNFYMKTSQLHDEYGEVVANAVCLNNGKFIYCNNGDAITPIDCELVVK